MAKNTVEYDIIGRDKSGKATRSARENVDKTTKSFKSFGKVLKGGLAVGGAIAAVKTLSNVVGDLTDAYSVQENAEAKLAQAVRNNPLLDGSSASRIHDFASELQEVTNIGDEVSISMAGMLGSFGRSEEEIRNVIEAAADLAAATDLTLESAITNLNKTFGGLSGELGELVPELKDFTTEQLEAGEAVELIGEQFEGAAAAAADTYSGSVDGLQAAIGDLKEQAGQDFADAAQPFIGWLTNVISNAAEAREAVRNMQEEVENLESGGVGEVGDIQAAREQLQAERKQLRTRLSALQPYADSGSGQIEEVETRLSEIASNLNRLGEAERQRARQSAQTSDSGSGSSGPTAAQALANTIFDVQDSLIVSLNEIENVNGLMQSEEEIRKAKNEAIEDAIEEMAQSVHDAGQPVEAWAGSGTVIEHWLNRLGENMEGGSKAVSDFAESVEESQPKKADFSDVGFGSAQLTQGENDREFALGQTAKTFSPEAPAASLGDELGGIKGIIGSVGDSLGGLAGSITSAVMAFGPLGLAIEAVKQVIQGLGAVLGPIINAALRPLKSLLQGIGAVIGQILTPVFNLLGQILKPIVTLLNAVLTPVMDILAVVIQQTVLSLSILMPIIQLLAEVIQIALIPINLLAEAFIFFNNKVIVPISEKILGAIEGLVNGIANGINSFIEGINDAIPGSRFDIGFRVSTVDLSSSGPQTIESGNRDPLASGQALTTGNTEAGGVGSGGGGTTRRVYNVNVEVNTEVIAGDEGIQSLAILIRDEIRAAEALGA